LHALELPDEAEVGGLALRIGGAGALGVQDAAAHARQPLPPHAALG